MEFWLIVIVLVVTGLIVAPVAVIRKRRSNLALQQADRAVSFDIQEMEDSITGLRFNTQLEGNRDKAEYDLDRADRAVKSARQAHGAALPDKVLEQLAIAQSHYDRADAIMHGTEPDELPAATSQGTTSGASMATVHRTTIRRPPYVPKPVTLKLWYGISFSASQVIVNLALGIFVNDGDSSRMNANMAFVWLAVLMVCIVLNHKEGNDAKRFNYIAERLDHTDRMLAELQAAPNREIQAAAQEIAALIISDSDDKR
jgi:hypothetical protein